MTQVPQPAGASKPTWTINIFYGGMKYIESFPHAPSSNSCAARLRLRGVLPQKARVSSKYGTAQQPIPLQEALADGSTIFLE